MTLTSPPAVLQQGSHSAQLFREWVSTLVHPAGGTVQQQDFALTQNGTPNMSVNVGAGRLWVPSTYLGTVNPGGGAYYPGGLYYAENDATVNLPISASNPTNPRLDQVIAQIQDAAYAGSTNSAQLAILTGTPTSGASLTNLVGLASMPASSLLLGYVLVPANATSIVTGDIQAAAAGATPGLPLLTPVLTTASAYTASPGQQVFAYGPPQTISLPNAPPAGSMVGIFTANQAAGSQVTVQAQGSDKIMILGAMNMTSFPLGTSGSGVVLMYDGAGQWLCIAGEQDSGWQALSLASGASSEGNYTPAARLRGDTVSLCGGVNLTSGSTVIANSLPSSSMRPAQDVAGGIAFGATQTVSGVQVTPAGQVSLAGGSMSGTPLVYLDGFTYRLS